MTETQNEDPAAQSRELLGHKVNPANDRLKVEAMDAPGSGGANHEYRISGFSREVGTPEGPALDAEVTLAFQNGPINEVGVNGVTHEVLLAILIDRLEGFQQGPFACWPNVRVLEHLREAQAALHGRTRDRMARGVEGTHEV